MSSPGTVTEISKIHCCCDTVMNKNDLSLTPERVK